MPFPAGERSLAVAVLSYAGEVAFGLLGCFDVMHDLDVLAEGIEGSIATLVARAEV